MDEAAGRERGFRLVTGLPCAGRKGRLAGVAAAGVAAVYAWVLFAALPGSPSVLLTLLMLVGIALMATGFLAGRGLLRGRQPAPLSLAQGNELLGDLRSRLDQQARLPDLGLEYSIETCVLPAAGAPFSGDFSVAVRRGDEAEVALTDVSGHGPSAGMRALLLSGALSGLLGEVPPHGFLPAANRYLIRQGWRDGFASCIHLYLHLADGHFDVGTAGHPSAAHFHAETGRWELVSGTAGLLLGLFELEADDYSRAQGVLEPGDVLLLYTDGVVEGDRGDIIEGTERMLQYASAALEQGVEGAARRICAASLADGGHDDRSAVVMWRRG